MVKYSGKKQESMCWVLETQFAVLNRVVIEKVRFYRALEGGGTLALRIRGKKVLRYRWLCSAVAWRPLWQEHSGVGGVCEGG